MGTTQVRRARAPPRAPAAPRGAHSRARAPQFKLQCRKLGIARWPHRKLKSLSGLISSCKAASGRMRSEKLKEALTEWTTQLEAVKARRGAARAAAMRAARGSARARPAACGARESLSRALTPRRRRHRWTAWRARPPRLTCRPSWTASGSGT